MATARRAGRPIGPADAWIAAMALRYSVPLVTHNPSDYAGVPGLSALSRERKGNMPLWALLGLMLGIGGGYACGWAVRPAPAEAAPTMRKLVVMLPMRDGVRLATDVCLPPGSGPWPAALERQIYGKPQEVDDRFARQRIVRVEQDMRGTGASEGVWRLGTDDAWGKLQDGAETIAWIRHQPWCNGKVATFGLPIPQALLAGAGPEGLVGQLAGIAPISLYQSVIYQNGVLRGMMAEWMREWRVDLDPLVRQHPSYDDFWRSTDLRTRLDRVRWPAVHWSGWFDVFEQSTLDAFTELQAHGGPGARGRQYLTIGPWDHGSFMQPQTGELTFPMNATAPGTPDDLAWLRHWLKGEPTISANEPAVRYYVMGDTTDPKAPGNTWRTADRWPPPSHPRRLYFTPEGGLTARQSATTTERSYDYDPTHPVPMRGGQEWTPVRGPCDQRPVEDRPDVLRFTSEPLQEPLEVTGRLWVRLYAASSARDTDFTAKLCDVYPDGRSMLVADGIVRARYRRSLEQPSPITPGKPYAYDIDLGSTSLIFNRGHRIRAAISSSNAPRFEPNPNTWPGDKSEKPVIARQTILLGGAQASCIILPEALPPRAGRRKE